MSAEVPWVVESNDGKRRRRYRGRQRRGTVPAAAKDDADLRLAVRELVAARASLAAAHAMEVVDGCGRLTRRMAIAEAVGKLAWVTRLIDALCVRRSCLCGDQVSPRKRTR